MPELWEKSERERSPLNNPSRERAAAAYYKCQHCSYVSKTEGSLITHVAKYHEKAVAEEGERAREGGNQRACTCPKCGKEQWFSSYRPGDQTVCPACLNHYEIANGQFMGPPMIINPQTRQPYHSAFSPEAIKDRGERVAARSSPGTPLRPL